MKLYRVKFYKYETNGDTEKQIYLGYLDVLGNKLVDGCSVVAKAFRLAPPDLVKANSVEIEEL